MKYLFSRCQGNCGGKLIEKEALYKISNDDLVKMEFCNNNCKALKNDNLLCKFFYKEQEYFYILQQPTNQQVSFSILNGKDLVSIDLKGSLQIFINGELEFCEIVNGLNYSHYEKLGKNLILYFSGKRKFVLIINNSKVEIGTYYDEFNQKDNERYFMCKLLDCLNHGKVVHISNENVENYLVYLDDNDLCLKPKFVSSVFVDCLLAGNFKYCNNLLSSNLKQEEPKNIKEFFCDFDFAFLLEENTFAMMKKNTLAGIYKFEVDNLSISNVVEISK